MKTGLNPKKWTVALAISVIAFLVLGACSDDDSSTGTQTGTGLALILIHDAPVDSLKEVWLTVSSIRLIGGDADTTGEMVLDEPLRLDFLSLDSVSRVLALAELEATSFSKIRLEVSDPEFLDKNDSIIGASEIQLVANGKVDLNFQGEVVIAPDEVTIIGLDLDVDSSIQVHQTGNGTYILHPQIKLDPAIESGTAIEIEGATITSVDLGAGTLVVTSPGSDTPITIVTDESTEFKDSGGSSIQLADLSPGMVLEIEGLIDPDSGEITATEIKVTS